MEDLRDLLDIQIDDAHRVLADSEDEMAVYNAIRNGVKSAYRTKCVSTLGASAQVDAPFSAV